MTGIKFCGLKRMCDIGFTNCIKPDYAGFVFAPGSRRFIQPSEASELVCALDPSIRSVGVFLDAEPEYVVDCISESGVSCVQVHGDLDNGYIREVVSSTGLPVIQAFSVSSKEDIDDAMGSDAEMVLLDNGLGGSGRVFDWSLIEDIGRPFFIAGGLDTANVLDVIEIAHPFAVDVSSGIETGGLKDPVKMEAFAEAVRGISKKE